MQQQKCTYVYALTIHRDVSSEHAAWKFAPGERQQHICSSFRPPLYLSTPSLRVLGASMMVAELLKDPCCRVDQHT